MLKQRSLKFKTLVITLTLVLLPLLAFSVICFSLVKESVFSSASNELHGQVEMQKKNIELTFDLAKDAPLESVRAKLEPIIGSIKVGKTGYMYIINSKGDLVIHPKLQGKNIAQYSFIQEIMNKKSGFIQYEWEGKAKITAYEYYPKHDWIIVSGSYLADYEDVVASIFQVIMIFLVIAFAIGFAGAFWFANFLSRPLSMISHRISDSSTQVASASTQLSSASQTLSHASSIQASSIEETTASLEEIDGMIENNLKNAEKAKEMADVVGGIAAKGNESMSELVGSMNEILEANTNIEKLVGVISEIGAKTKIIDEIVFQTKLLSFNASVEAERAGEHGRGFAVVAQEVGNLAQLSGRAALEISKIVKESIKSAEQITLDNKKKVEKGNGLVRSTAIHLKETNEKVNIVSGSATQVVDASKEQASGIRQISHAMDQLSKITQENVATAEETAASSEELAAQTESMNELVAELNEFVFGANHESVQAIKKAIPVPADKLVLSEVREMPISPKQSLKISA